MYNRSHYSAAPGEGMYLHLASRSNAIHGGHTKVLSRQLSTAPHSLKITLYFHGFCPIDGRHGLTLGATDQKVHPCADGR